ncbi:MAG: tetraacyldisaccharide 4'-kinase [Burkholderiaceae bacterium]
MRVDRISWSRYLQQSWLKRGPLALGLLPLAAAYWLLSTSRTWLYEQGWLQSCTLGVPVIVVGNLIAGGAGKTPTVLAVVELLRRRGFTPGIISRGFAGSYRGILEVQADTAAEACGDEPKLLKLRSRAPVMVGRDRVAAGRELLRRHVQVNVLVSDDGLQHRRLRRDAQVIVFDERGAGNGWLLPAGPLREPLTQSAPARSVVLYNAAQPSTHWPGTNAMRSLAGVVELGCWWRGNSAFPETLEALRGRSILAAAGIANPQRFFGLLGELGLTCRTLPLPDHFPYTRLPWPDSEADVVVTEKDAVKIDPQRVGRTRVWVAALDFRASPEFEAALMALLPPIPAQGIDHGSASA